jgi:gliding motility-associated-like protein
LGIFEKFLFSYLFMKNLFNFSRSNIPSITRFLNMYKQLPFRVQNLAFTVGLMFLVIMTFNNSLHAQCTLGIESTVFTDADCGQNNGTAEVVSTGAVAPLSFSWSNGATTAAVTGLAAGIYTVTVTDANCSQTTTFFINSTNAPTVSTLTNPDTCVTATTNGSIELNITGTSPYSVSWAGPSSGTNTVTGAADTINNLEAGSYNITVSDASGCSAVLTVEVESSGNLTQTSSTTAPTCGGGTDGEISITSTTGSVPFDYFLNGVFVTQAFGPNTFSNLAGGEYITTVVDQSGCSVSDTFLLDEAGSTTLNAGDFTITDATCPGGFGSISSFTCPTCEVYDNAGNLLGTLATAINNLIEGNYEVRQSNAGCISYFPFSISEPTGWNFSVVATNPSCVAANADVTVSGATGPYSYNWSNGATTQDLSGVTAGTYNLTVTDANACALVRNNITLPSCSSIDTVSVTLFAGSSSTNCVDTTGLPGTMVSVSDLGCATLTNGTLTNINNVDACIDYTANNNAGMDTICIAICDNNAFCDTTVFVYNIVPAADTAIITLAAQNTTNSVDTCPLNLQLSGPLASVNDLGCDQQNEGTISVDITTGCVSYVPPVSAQNSGTRSDTICLELCDANGYCDTMVYIFNNLEPNCTNLLPNNPIVQQFVDCSVLTACMPSVPFDSVQSGYYDFTVYFDQTYTSIFSATQANPCNQVTRIQYPFVLIPGCSGDYEVTWNANGVIYGPDTVSGLNGIINFMNFNDGNTAWTLNGNSTVATGTNTNSSINYNNLTVTCIGTGTVTNVGPTVQPQYAQGTELSFPTAGTYPVVVEDTYFGCSDTVLTTIYCATTDQFQDTILVGESATYCLDTTEVPSVDTIFNFCANTSTNSANFIIDQNTACITYIGDSIGSDLGCFLLCSNSGVCDTTYMFIDVALPAPIAVDDSLILVFGQSAGTVDVCVNDTFDNSNYTIAVITQPSKGTLNQNDCSFTYTVNGDNCGEDFFEYIIFNPWGADTATVIIDIACDPFLVYDGFSPNGDGINDVFVIQTIQNFPGNRISIYNRWGNKVYEQTDYQNDWDGTFNGKDLPDDFYYVIVYGADEAILAQKWIRIAR